MSKQKHLEKILRLDLKGGQYLKINLDNRMVHRYNRKGDIIESTILTPFQYHIMKEKLLKITEEQEQE